jgi:ribosomal protein S3
MSVPDAALREIVRALCPVGTQVLEVTKHEDKTGTIVTIRTNEPGRVVGRRNETSDRIRARLEEELDTKPVHIRIELPNDPGPAPDPPSGVREPRRPIGDPPSQVARRSWPDPP